MKVLQKYLPVLLLVSVLLLAVLVFWFARTRQTELVIPSSRPVVAASTYTLSHFTGIVGGADIQLVPLASQSVSAHDFEPTAREVGDILAADLFISHGAGLDPWASDLHPEVVANGGATLVVTDSFDLREAGAEGSDPHIWLDPVLAKREVELIRDALVARDPSHAAGYSERANRYLGELEQLHQEFTAGLSQCAQPEIIVSHDAFGYLADRYGFQLHAIAGVSPDEEPSAAHLAELTTVARDRGISVIFFETLVSPKLAQTLANEVGAQVMVLNPVEALTPEEEAEGATYLTMMHTNLVNLRAAMQCQ